MAMAGIDERHIEKTERKWRKNGEKMEKKWRKCSHLGEKPIAVR